MATWQKIKPEEKAVYLAWYEGRSTFTHILFGENYRDSVKDGFWMKMRKKDYKNLQELIKEVAENP